MRFRSQILTGSLSLVYLFFKVSFTNLDGERVVRRTRRVRSGKHAEINQHLIIPMTLNNSPDRPDITPEILRFTLFSIYKVIFTPRSLVSVLSFSVFDEQEITTAAPIVPGRGTYGGSPIRQGRGTVHTERRHLGEE